MIKTNYHINYDHDADVLYVSFGKPQNAIGIEIEEGNIVRVDPFSESVRGITIIDFSYKYGKKASKNIEQSIESIVPEILHKFKNYQKTHNRRAVNS